LLIDAFEGLETEMKLVLAGGSSHTDEYASRLRQRQDARVRILDWLSGDALDEVLTNATVFILPSDMEGMSLSLLEAMGAGVCVLASDTPEYCEVIADCGFTFKSGDMHDLRRKMHFLLNNPRMGEAAGKTALRRVEQNYLWQHVTEQIEAVYRELMLRPAPRLLRSSEAARKSA
jgi:glycosyltransferase involved in cell wall biosynthesis